jgi:hypothetical protein
MPEADSMQPGRQFGGGRFTLIRMLGRGGMGIVWLARDGRLEEQVALKFLPPEVRENPPTLEHLRLETARSHLLTHPNIVRLHDFHEPPGEPAFISMEYIDGPSLHGVRAERPNGVLSWEYLRKILPQLCAALEYAHAENVIHRDLKPDNILIDSRGRAKLTDFGLAAAASDLARSASVGGGTLHYMSPQQLMGRYPDVTDDIYSLGAALYDLLTGSPPFQEDGLGLKILNETPEPIRDRLAARGIENRVPSDVAAMIMSCLAKEPAQRPQSAQAVRRWMEEAGDETSFAARPRPTPAASKPDRAKILRATVSVMVFLLLTEFVFWKMHTRRQAAPFPGRKLMSDERWTNSLGMVFVPVPNCEPLFCIWKTRVRDYQAMVAETGRTWEKPSFSQTPTDPAVNIKWNDARDFCQWLTQRERASGVIATNRYYRLPTDEEWSLAVTLDREPGETPKEKDGKVKDLYPWGTEWPPPRGSGNFDPRVGADDFPYTSPVGSFTPNLYGLYDMAGNAREWCEDLYAPGSKRHVVRGSAWFDAPQATLLSSRRALTPAQRHDDRYDYFGFRCVLATGERMP